MKRFIRYFLSVLLVLPFAAPAFAGPVDASRAGEVARVFFQSDQNVARRMSPFRRVNLYEAPLTKAGDATPAFHIFSREGGGFVIVAGDDLCKPVLAYSYENDFADVERIPALKAYLADFEEQVAVVRAQGIPQKSADLAKSQWMSAQYPTKAGNKFKPEVKHETALFNQGNPFNLYCPTISGGGRGYTGCVPTAMCIVMRFFKHPAAGTGSLPSYEWEYQGEKGSVAGYDLGYPYQWDKMRLDYGKGYTQEEAEAVSRLMYDVGVAAKAKYTSTIGTDTNFWNLLPAVIEYFGYDPNVNHIKRMYFTDEEWMAMIKTELQDHPLIYAGSSEDSGHGFVVDGYDKQDYLSINWGWGGSSNGYFALSAFVLGANSHFKYAHTTVLGLVPDKGQGGQPEEYLFMNGDADWHGMYALSSPVRGQEFKMGVAYVWNGGVTAFAGKFFFALTDKEGNIVERISEEGSFGELQPRGGVSFWNIPCNMTCYPLEGDKITLFYRSDHWPEGVWKEPLYYLENPDLVKEIPVQADGTALVLETTFKYDKTAGKCTIKTKDRVKWSVKKSTGTVVAQGVTTADKTIEILESTLSKGAYTIILDRGEPQLGYYSFTLKTGK